MMADIKHKPSSSIFLNSQIRNVEQRLILRQHSISQNVAVLKQRINEKAGSPATLLAGVGIGFAAGYFDCRNKSALSAFTKLVDAVSLTEYIIGLLPKTETGPQTNID